LSKYPFEVTGCEKQRAAKPRAVITDPRILLADEPTGALDSKASASLLGQLTDLHQIGKTIVMVTHSAMAASYASRVLFISDGSLFSQLYRGEENNRAFFDRIVANLSILGGGDIA
jgi:putative ABC transport system ATP-binding protein